MLYKRIIKMQGEHFTLFFFSNHKYLQKASSQSYLQGRECASSDTTQAHKKKHLCTLKIFYVHNNLDYTKECLEMRVQITSN